MHIILPTTQMNTKWKQKKNTCEISGNKKVLFFRLVKVEAVEET